MSVLQVRIKNTREIEKKTKGSSVVTTKGYLMMYSSGLVVDATSAATPANIAGLCNETLASADARTDVEVIRLSHEDVFMISTTNNTNVAHNGQQMVLTDAVTANNTGTTDTSGPIVQVGVVGAAADKLILARFATL